MDECLSSVCGVHRSCFNTPGSFSCGCSPGFHRHENDTCTGESQCPDAANDTDLNVSHIKCVPNHVQLCENYIYRECFPIFSLTDINECSDPDVCGRNAHCYNHPGGYSCKCHEGYSNYGNNQSKCIGENYSIHFKCTDACLGCSVHYAAAAKNLIEVNQCYFLFFAVNCLIIVLSLMWLCTEMDCDQFEPESDGDRTPKKVKCVLLLMIIIVRYTVRLLYIDLHWSSSS